MKQFHNQRHVLVIILALSIGAASLLQAQATRRALHNPPSLRVTPPAPVFDQQERLMELAQRRSRVAQKVGNKAILILFSTEPRVYTSDVDYHYRQENNLYYLTNLKQKGATLVLMPGNPLLPEILFLPRRNTAAETWTGHMYSSQEAHQISGIKEIWDAADFEPFVRAVRNREPYRPKPDKIFMSALNDTAQATTTGFESFFEAAGKNEAELYLLVSRETESREYRREQRFGAEWRSVPNFSVKNAMPIFAEMRLRKSPMELRLLQHAIDITIEALQRSWLAGATAKWEYEIDAQVAYTFKLRNAHWGYPSIVGAGPNATTLHYDESSGPVRPGDLVLMDVGAEYEHYTADLTRTFPVNGKFSPAQAEVYQIVYAAQEAGAQVARPGTSISDVHRAATEVIKDGLLKLGLILDRNSEQYRIWFMHGTCHWIGMNVHDVGGAAKFEPGMVFTNEPGIYIRLDALDHMPFGWKQDEWEKFKVASRPAFEKYKGIGVRIEDDLVITADGVKWMSEALPRRLADVEDFIARVRISKN
jgi:Xaa-Pro aminopeptidase